MTGPHLFLNNRGAILRELRSRSTITPDGHCLWNGAINDDGYGSLWIDGKIYKTHRLSAYIHLNLDINDINQHALHKNSCPYKNCWSKDCLYIGTHQDNMKDLSNKLDSPTHFNCGHERIKTNIISSPSSATQ